MLPILQQPSKRGWGDQAAGPPLAPLPFQAAPNTGASERGAQAGKHQQGVVTFWKLPCLPVKPGTPTQHEDSPLLAQSPELCSRPAQQPQLTGRTAGGGVYIYRALLMRSSR